MPLIKKRRFFELKNYDEIDLILAPGFVMYTDPNEDKNTDSLMQRYAAAKNKVTELYREKSYFDTTIRQWVSGGSHE